MKKTIVSVISVYLFFMFLVYFGVFRDNTNPIEVTKYYFECIKNREGFLTFQISKPEFFNEDRFGTLYSKYGMNLMREIKFDLLYINETNAFVEEKIIYKDSRVNYATVELEKAEKRWLIKGIKYKS